MYLLLFKTLHIIGFVAWLAGLFYLGRLFVYSAASGEKAEPEKSILNRQFSLMQWRVYRFVANPAMMVTLTFGIIMLIIGEGYMKQPWIHIKLLFLVFLLVHHLRSKRVIKKLEAGTSKMSDFQLRLFAQEPAFFLVAIAFLAVLGKAGVLNYPVYFGGVAVFGLVLFLIAKKQVANKPE